MAKNYENALWFVDEDSRKIFTKDCQNFKRTDDSANVW